MSDYTILLELAIILLATKTFGLFLRRLGFPQVVGMLIAGILIGPCVLKIVNPSVTLKVLAEVGVIMIMFSAGLETNIKDIKSTGLPALVVALAGVILPLAGGFCISAAFHGGFRNLDTFTILKNTFVGVIMTATSVSITVETLRELGKLKTKAGTIILSAAIFDDVIGIAILSIITGLKNPDVKPLKAILSIVLFFIAAIGVGILLHIAFKWFSKRFAHKRRVPIFGLVICFGYAYCAEKFFGVADITGAYIAGIVLSGLRESEYIDHKVETNAYMLFSPIFFASIGINATFDNFSLNLLWFFLAFVFVAVFMKFLGCFCASKIMRLNNEDSAIIGVGMIARGEVCLIVMQKGISAGLIESEYVTMAVLLVVISSLIAPILLKAVYQLSSKKQGKKLQTITPQEGETASASEPKS